VRPTESAHSWLLDAAVSAGMADAAVTATNLPETLSGAWTTAAHACGVTPAHLAEAVARAFGLELADPRNVDALASRLIPERFARLYETAALAEDDQHLYVATADPTRLDAERDIGFASGRTVVFRVAPPQVVAELITSQYDGGATFESVLGDLTEDLAAAVQVVEDAAPQEVDSEDAESAPVVRLSNLIMRAAMEQNASDVHFEPGRGEGTVRMRVDGVMRVFMHMPMATHNRVTSRIKIMARLDIADRLHPQDGRARVQVDGTSLDLRISTVPTRESEKTVIRLLNPKGSEHLDSLGLSPDDLRRVRRLIGFRSGIVLVTGPTGSGKTSTLYAAIRELASTEVNVMTVEDPIEYEIPGITQMQVELKRNVTFSNALRAVLRQDPDVILIGEIRDSETAHIAVQASMTGHRVLATLHTNDAASAVSRLTDLGLDRASIANTLRGVLAQRLVRRICPHCTKPHPGALTAAEEQLQTVYHVAPTMLGEGCTRCGGTGYLGRVPVLQVLSVTPAMTEMLGRGAPLAELERAAVAGGMHSLLEAGAARVASGETTLQELERVIGQGHEVQPPAPVSKSANFGEHRVLVIDDDATHRRIARRLLEKADFDVVEAVDGESGIDTLTRDTDFVLVLLDLTLPGKSGRDVFEWMRRRGDLAEVPVVVLTASEDPETEAELMEIGVDDYIRKPIEPRRFIARVRATLRRAAA